MRILAVGNGTSIHVRARLAATAGRGHDVVLVTEAPGGDGCLREIAPPPGAGALAGLAALWRALRDEPADMLHVHYAAGYGAWLAGACGRSPLVVSVMGGDVLPEEQVPQNAAERWLTTRLLRRADLVTSKSAHLTGRLVAMGVAPPRILPLVWGVDQGRFRRRDASALRQRLGLDPAARVVLSPRALRPFYNIHVIVDAFAVLASTHPDAVLVVTGHQPDAGYAAMLARRVETLELAGRVRFIGDVIAADMPELYSLAEAVVSVPSSDGIPQSLLEALACGVPVVLSDLERYREWVEDGRSALMVEITPEAIAGALARLLGDAGLRDRLVANGAEIIAGGGGLDANLDRLEAAMAGLPKAARARPHLAMLVVLAALVVGRAVAARLPFPRRDL